MIEYIWLRAHTGSQIFQESSMVHLLKNYILTLYAFALHTQPCMQPSTHTTIYACADPSMHTSMCVDGGVCEHAYYLLIYIITYLRLNIY